MAYAMQFCFCTAKKSQALIDELGRGAQLGVMQGVPARVMSVARNTPPVWAWS